MTHIMRVRLDVYRFLRQPADRNASSERLERSTELLKLSLSHRPGDWVHERPYIELYDIVSTTRGSGIGTAVLEEVCAYADEQTKPIIALFLPDASAKQGDIPRLARWFQRHGFRQGGRSPESWIQAARMIREPQPLL